MYHGKNIMVVDPVPSTDGGHTDEPPDILENDYLSVMCGSVPPWLARTGRSSMTANATPIGHCPECGRSIPSGWALIEYERSNGERGVYAECPSCASIIRPE